MNNTERHQISSDYSMEMDSSSDFNSGGYDDVMDGSYRLYKELAPRLRKLRVRVKRLPREVLERYQEKKLVAKFSSTMPKPYRPLNRPEQKPFKQQMLMNKPKPQVNIGHIVESVTSQPSAALLNLLRNNYKQQSLAGQKLGGVNSSGGPAASKTHPNTNGNKTNVTIRQIKQPLQTEHTKVPSIKKEDTRGPGYTKGPSPVKNISVVTMESKKTLEMRKETIQVKKAVNRSALVDFLSNFNEGASGGAVTQKNVDAKRVIVRSVGSTKNQQIVSQNTINIKNAANKSIVMDTQTLVKKEFSPIATSNQQKQSNPNSEWHKNKQAALRDISRQQQVDTSRTKVTNAVNKDPAAGAGCSKTPAEKPIQPKDLDITASREVVRKTVKINQPFNAPPYALLPKIVKQPKMVKVPISKLIKIPQGIIISKSTDQPDMAKALNSAKNFETVNLSKVVKNSDTAGGTKALKMPESCKLGNEAKGPGVLNQSNVIKIPQATKISKVVKSPEMVRVVKLPNTQNLTAVKLVDSNTIKNVAKAAETVILSKVVELPEVATKVGSSNLKLSAFYQSQCTQTEPDDRPTLKSMNKSLTCQAKSVQTKFTCNDNICGIIDTAEFNISCFYCYDAFPLRKWSSFIRHMKTSHRLEERSHAAADALLKPKNIIPYGMKSKEVQVNTLKGRNILGGKRKINATETIIKNNTDMDDMESTYDSQLENDLEIALNCIDENESDELGELAKLASNSSAPRKILKLENERMVVSQPHNVLLIEPKVEEMPQTNMDESNAKLSINRSTAATDVVVVAASKPVAPTSDGQKLTEHPLFKNKIINLPSNMKIIKRLPNKETTSGEITKSSEQMPDNSQAKIVVLPKIIKAPTAIKTEDAPESPNYNTTIQSIDSFSADVIAQSSIAKDGRFEICEFRLDDSCAEVKNDSLDISKTDVEQNVKIEPDFDNDSGDEAALLRIKDEGKSRSRKYMNSRKNPMATQKSRPIPPNLLDSDDEMPSNDENEDELPSPTNGCGILFGLTNRNIVIEFINELQKYPELWRFNRNNDITINYNESIRNLHQHINEKFNLEMTEFEVRLSVQRIKYWYCRTLQKMEKHRKNPQPNKEPFRYTFPEYFKMLQKFLSYDSNCAKDLVLGKRFQKKDVNELNRYPKWMLYKEPGGGKGSTVMPDDRCSLARDLQFSEDGETDQEEEGYTPSLKPFKSELDTSAAPPDPFICDICFIDFNSMVELTRHRSRHFPPQYPCSTCNRLYYSSHVAEKCSHGSTKKEMSDKQRSPAKEQQPTLCVCEICGVSYKSLSTLNYHKRDKHFNMRHKCPVCKFTSISNYRMVQHQKKRHVVDFGTCEEIAKKTRSRTDSKIPFNAEARREFEWRREMRKKTQPGELFYGCYKCKSVFKSRKEKVQHNRKEHPITEATVICQLCSKEKALFSNSNSVRRHYTDVHKVPWDEIDDLVKRTKPLFQTLTPLEVDQLKSSDNPCEFVAKTLARKLKAEQQNAADVGCEITRAIKSLSGDMEEELNHTYDPFKFENNTERRLKLENILLSHDEDSIDDEYYRSTFFNDIGIDHDYDDMQDESYYEDEDDDYYVPSPRDYASGQPNSKEFQQYEYQDDDGNEHYIIEEECVAVGEFAEIDVGQPADQQLAYDGVLQNCMNEEEIVEEIVEYDFIEDVMEDRY